MRFGFVGYLFWDGDIAFYFFGWFGRWYGFVWIWIRFVLIIWAGGLVVLVVFG